MHCYVALWEHAACRGGGGHSKQALLLTVWRRSAHEACIHSWPSQKQMEATVCGILRLPSKLQPFFAPRLPHREKLSFKTTPTMHVLHTHFLWCGWRVEKTSLKQRSMAFKFLLFTCRYASASSSFFLASCASLDLHEENLSAPHFPHVQNVSSGNSEYSHFSFDGGNLSAIQTSRNIQLWCDHHKLRKSFSSEKQIVFPRCLTEMVADYKITCTMKCASAPPLLLNLTCSCLMVGEPGGNPDRHGASRSVV